MEIINWLLILSFIIFSILFIISIIFTIKLIVPEEVAYLKAPKSYYEEYRLTYEQTINDKKKVEDLLKASYIDELEAALNNNELVLRHKSSFYYNALIYALLSSVPYLVCLGFHVSKKEDKIQKVQVISYEKNGKLHQTNTMSDNQSNNNSTSNSTTTTSTTTKLPGVDNSQVISSSPNMVKENSPNISVKKK